MARDNEVQKSSTMEVTVRGNIASEPTKSGDAVFIGVVSNSVNYAGEKGSQYINVSLFGAYGRYVLANLKKGDRVVVKGLAYFTEYKDEVRINVEAQWAAYDPLFFDAKRSHEDDEDEAPRSRRRSSRDDEDDEAPRSRRRRSRDEDDEDEAPRSRRRSRDEDDDDVEEERPRRRRSRDEDDEDEAPRSRRRPSRSRDEDDEDDDVEEERPRRRRSSR